MPDGVNTAIKEQQAPEPQSMVNRVGAQPELHQLCPGHHPMLPLRKLPDCPIEVTRSSFAAYLAVNADLVAHAGQDGAPGRNGGLRALLVRAVSLPDEFQAGQG